MAPKTNIIMVSRLRAHRWTKSDTVALRRTSPNWFTPIGHRTSLTSLPCAATSAAGEAHPRFPAELDGGPGTGPRRMTGRSAHDRDCPGDMWVRVSVRATFNNASVKPLPGDGAGCRATGVVAVAVAVMGRESWRMEG